MEYILVLKASSQMINYKGKLIVIAGPTASGKSDIASRLAKDIGGYILNGDSRQIYKYLDIGTAKPKKEEIEQTCVKHFLYDFVDPKENFTLFEYQKRVQSILDTQNSIPILTGGTGLYIDSIVFNYDLSENKIKEDLSAFSLERLQEIAKEYLSAMTESDRKNRHRLIRAIQREGLGKRKGEAINHIYFVIDIPKEELKKRIDARIEKMFEDGLLKENEKLLSMGYTYEDKGMNSIGYKEFKDYFEKRISLEEVKENIRKNTYSYAKRQRTWFRRNKNAIWTSNYDNILDLASSFITKE